MSRMTQRGESVRRLAVWIETSVGSGQFELDERLGVDEVSLRSGTAVSSARISVRLDDGFDAEDCRRRYRAELRIRVGVESTEPALGEFLFEGYPPVQEARWEGLRGRGEEAYTFLAEGVYERLSRTRESQIFGRFARTGEIADGLAADPAAWQDKADRVVATPCAFNADGVMNCDKSPLTVTTPEGQTRSVHVFCYDGKPLQEAWTYGRALRYLVWFHLPREGPVLAGNVWDVTEPIIALQPGDVDRFTREQILERTLLREVDGLNCEGTNLVEALGLWAASAGLQVTAETVGESAGEARTQLRIWSGQAGPLCWLSLARGGYDPDGQERYPTAQRSARQVLEDNDLYAGRVRWNEKPIVNAPIVIGDVKRHEVTVELKPGWLPQFNLDNVPAGSRDAAKAEALIPEDVEALGNAVEAVTWFRRHHRAGSEYRFYAHVSRRWLLNEHGYYTNPAYERNAPFDDYSAFDFSTVMDPSITRRGKWMRRPRPMARPLTRTAENGASRVWVEISFDSGVTWHQQAGGVRILDDECGLMFEVDNPTEITPPGTDPREQNIWYAIIDQTFRVRMTGTIESDERVLIERAAGRSDAPVLTVNTELLYLPGRFRFAGRAGTTNMLADVNPAGAHDERDDTAAADTLAEQIARQHQDRRIDALPAIPWIDTEFVIGDRIAGVRGRELRFATAAGLDGRFPAVVGKRYHLNQGRYETILELTRTNVRL